MKPVLVQTPQGTLEFPDFQVDALIARGTLTRDSGIVRGESKDAVIAALEAEPSLQICDFCSQGGVTWRFPCRDFATGLDPQRGQVVPLEMSGNLAVVPDGTTPLRGSISDWLACDTCAELVRNGDREKLARRTADSMTSAFGLSHEERRFCYLASRDTQDVFWSNREGEGEPIRRSE